MKKIYLFDLENYEEDNYIEFNQSDYMPTIINEELIDPINEGLIDKKLSKYLKKMKEELSIIKTHENKKIQERLLKKIKKHLINKINSNNIEDCDKLILIDILNDFDYIFELNNPKIKKQSTI